MNLKTLIKKVAKASTPHGLLVLYKRRLEVYSQTANIATKGVLDKRKIAVIVPFRNVKYAQLLKSGIERAGFKAMDSPNDARYIWLHWYENGISDYADFLDKLSVIKAWKNQGRKVIVHIHNKKPHESPVPNISHALMTVLVDTADRVVIMSSETKGVLRNMWYYGDDFSNVSTIPHPNYIGAYGKKLVSGSLLSNNRLRILFFGLVRPYKGIENLIEATKGMKDVEISIFGKPKDDVYVAKIQKLCEARKNINFRLEHIPDEDIPRIFADHHVVALPYSAESSLNSGAALLALSYARTIVGTNNGTLKDLESSDLYFGYDYSSEADHVKQLKSTIQGIRKEYGGQYNKLTGIGERAFESVGRHNGIEVVAGAIRKMIDQLK